MKARTVDLIGDKRRKRSNHRAHRRSGGAKTDIIAIRAIRDGDARSCMGCGGAAAHHVAITNHEVRLCLDCFSALECAFVTYDQGRSRARSKGGRRCR